METYSIDLGIEQCPKCKSIDIEQDISSKVRFCKCKMCGYRSDRKGFNLLDLRDLHEMYDRDDANTFSKNFNSKRKR